QEAGPRSASCGALPDLCRRVAPEDVEEGVNGFSVGQHRQPFYRPEAQRLVSTVGIKFQRSECFCRLNAAIAESAESPQRHEPLCGAALDLGLEFFQAFRSLQ